MTESASNNHPPAGATGPDRARAEMVQAIGRELLELHGGQPAATRHRRVMRALGRVPRHRFVAAGDEDVAYHDSALRIGHGQTISQPFIVALMSDLLSVGAEDVVLEVGTGSGYQAAVLAELVSRVYSVEVIPELAVAARERLHELGYRNVAVREGDGAEGWPERAPFDGIIVTAAASSVPPALLQQLRSGARLVMPVGRPAWSQQLTVVQRHAGGRVTADPVLAVRFVPLTHAETAGGRQRQARWKRAFRQRD